MRYGSVCSGIEAATVAWHSLGWEAAWYSEIEPFPCAVLKHHYPHVPNYGDMTKFEEWPNESIELLVGGTPCQSFSVAGLRKGLADPRGNLMLTYGAIARRYRPEWLVWENVPGVLSSNRGRDFETFLGMLAELGYGFAYRVLDAQYFGVAQRRRRVFVVANARSWQRAAAVLFERESVRRDTAPSREKREATTGGASHSVANGGVPAVAETLIATDHKGPGHNRDHNFIAQTFAKTHKPMSAIDAEGWSQIEAAPTVTHWPRDRSDTGTDVAVVQPITFGAQMSEPQSDVDMVQTLQAKNPMAVAFRDVAQALTSNYGKQPDNSDMAKGPNIVAQPIAIHPHVVGRSPNAGPQGKEYIEDGSAYCMDARGVPQSVAQPMAFQQNTRDEVRYINGDGQIVGALAAESVMKQTNYISQPPMQVRRLTPVECERLQGFPDNYTNIPWRKKDEAPDGPRYKALGNSMAVPVMRWIGERIQKVSEL